MSNDVDRLVPDPAFREELGGVSAMWTWRRDRNPPPDWPTPIKIGNRTFRYRSQVESYKGALLRHALQTHGVAAEASAA